MSDELTTVRPSASETYTRFLLYTSNDADDMQHPVSTATPMGVYDTEEEAYAAWNEEAEEDHGAIVEAIITVKSTQRISFDYNAAFSDAVPPSE